MNTLTQINIKYFLFYVFLLFFTTQIEAQKNEKQFVLVLDAGHGGHDGGTNGLHLDEKYIALDITLKLGKKIEKYYGDDVKVIYTRKSDVFIELAERANIANRNNADFFISIHCNSFKPRPAAKGTETFVLGTEPKRADANFNIVKRENSVILLEDNHQEKYQGFDPSSPESVIGLTLMQNIHLDNSLRFAKAVEDNFVYKYNRKSRGVKQAGFLVLWRTATPSVLIETGFLSNPEESKYLDSEKGKEETSEAIFDAFKSYKKEWDIRNGLSNTKNNEKIVPKKEVKKEIEKPVEGKLFKIQILTSKRKFKSSAPQLKGLRPVEVVKSGDLYKYYYGSTNLISQRNYYLNNAKRSGFPDAFVVEIDSKKEESKIEEKKEEEKKESNVNANTGYRIQILTSQRNYYANAPQLKGIKPLDKIETNGLYRYFYGWYKTEKQAEIELSKIKSKGFPDAFVVKFLDGKKM